MRKFRHKHAGIKAIDYYAYTSGMKDWNASFKIAFSFLTLILCILLNNIYISLFVLISMSFLIIYKGKVHLHDYLRLLTIPLTFIILGTITIAVVISKVPYGEFNIRIFNFYVCLSKENTINAINIAVKALGAISSMYMMTLSTSINEIIMVLKKIHIPLIIIELMYMIYRFVFILNDTYHNMKVSSKSRLGYVDFKTSCLSFGSNLSNLLIVGLKRADNYFKSLESRCYTGELSFLVSHKNIKVQHIIWSVVYFIAMLFIALLTSKLL